MAVKTFCNICERFIKDIDAPNTQKLTGKEICEDCGKKVGEAQAFLDTSISKYKADLERLLTETKKKFNGLDAAYKKFFADATSLYSTTDAELKARLEDIIK